LSSLIPYPWHIKKEDEDNPDLLGYVQTISIKASNSVYSTPNPQSYSVYNYKPRKHIDLSSMSPYIKIFDSSKFFVSKIHNLHVKIIKHIQASNEQ
jgi:hypothetical protein